MSGDDWGEAADPAVRCEAVRIWSGERCVLAFGHDGKHLDWEEAGLESPHESLGAAE